MSVMTSSCVGPSSMSRSWRSLKRSSSGPNLSQRPDSAHSSAGCTAGIRDLERAGAVHLLAHDVLDLAQDAQAHGQPGVEARGESPDEAGAQHELVAHDLGLGRDFLEGVDRVRGQAHAGIPQPGGACRRSQSAGS